MNKYLVPARRLEVYDVTNSAGQDLGQVQDFMIDMTTGRVAYVVVAFGGTLGLSDKWIAMPFEALCWAPEHRKFTVDLNREVLEKAPGIDKQKWPDHYAESESGWMNDLYNHYSCTPYWGKDTMSMAVVNDAPMRTTSTAPLFVPAREPARAPVRTPVTETVSTRKGGKFEVYQDKAGEFRFRLIASNGQIIAVSEGYKTKTSAMEGIQSVMANASTAPVEDLTAV